MINDYSDNERPELTERERQLLEQIEAVTVRREESRLDDPIMTFTHRLVQAQPPVHEAFQERLRSQLLALSRNQKVRKQMDNRERPFLFSWRLAVTAVFIAIILIIGVILITPAGRAWAKSFLARSGPVLITNEPTLPEQALTRTPEPQPTAPLSSRVPSEPQERITGAAEVSAAVGFAVFVPAYVPPGYELLRIQPMPAGNEVDTEYTSSEIVDGYFLLRQIFFQAPEGQEETFEWPVGDAPVIELTVRDQPAIWVEQSNQGQTYNEAGEPVLSTWNMLMWQEGEFLFWFFSKNLSLEETVKVAESLKPAALPHDD